MLKTFRVASFAVAGLAACGIVALIVFGLKGDPEIRDFLDKPSILDQLKKQLQGKQAAEEKIPPLVAQAKLISLRFDPPPPPAPPKPTVPPAPKPEVVRQQPKPASRPQPKVQQNVRFNLLATVVYESAPEKSLALLQSGSKQEWFRMGEKLGHQEIKEIKDGSVVFTQGGRNPQEVFVPAKPQVKSLLKNEPGSAVNRRTGPGGIQVQQPNVSTAAQTPTQVTDSGKIRVVRPTNEAARRQSLSERVQRVRSIPEPTLEEQKKSIDSSISGIQEILSSVAEADAPEEDKQSEQQVFAELLQILNAEKNRLEVGMQQQSDEEAASVENQNTQDSDEDADMEADNTEDDSESAAESDTEAEDTAETSPADPNTDPNNS